MNAKDFLSVSPEVAGALASGQPVVALESTIITHGMPYPQNLEMARGVEATVRANGAVPATVALIAGRMRAGLLPDELERLAQSGEEAVKASRRDLAPIIARKGVAGTTVATTMIIAELAGIKVFATGGIGGVHRGADQTFDISADLEELGRTPVAVVCAGAKSILDIPKTLEVLETKGVPVIGFGTDEFPAFYTRSSGQEVRLRYDGADELAEMLKTHFDLGLGGVVIGNPIPKENELDAQMIEKRIHQAINQAEEEHIFGKDLTPFLLRRLLEMTEGASLTANLALVNNNAAVAARIAVALAARIRA